MKTLETTYQTELKVKLKKEVVCKLSYFDVFHHPLTLEEIQNNINIKVSQEKLGTIIQPLLEEELIFKSDGYFSLRNNVRELIKQRNIKEDNAKKYFDKSDRYVRLISKFPFVRGIAFSGSLSKGLMAEDGDIDYFIITSKNRLWLSRTLMILFKKIFLLNSRKYFCVNYFVDTENLEIQDKNIFTATEIAYLIPVFGEDIMQDFNKKNTWTEEYYTHFKHDIRKEVQEPNFSIKTFFEWLLNGRVGNKLDLYFMKITLKRWQKKFEHFDKEKFDLTLRSERGISKHHPRDFQNKVLEKWKNNESRILKQIRN